ncbi:hypothetical protein C8Q79DRAFT_652176 [Trametes meyenii]|nr:hypothetical protein C8Q79DRAFT_652176 [Trametes meyenii]
MGAPWTHKEGDLNRSVLSPRKPQNPPPEIPMTSLPVNSAMALLGDLTRQVPGDHTIYLRSEAHSYNHSREPSASDAFTAPIAALMPNVVIKSHTPASRALRSALAADQTFVDAPPILQLPIVRRLLDIIGLVSSHHAAFVREEAALIVWGHEEQDVFFSTLHTQHLLDEWHAPFAVVVDSSRPSGFGGDAFDAFFHGYSSLPSTADGFTLALGLGSDGLAPLPFSRNTFVPAAPRQHASSLSHALRPRSIVDSPMLGDSPVGFMISEELYAGRCTTSPSPTPYLSPAYTLEYLAPSPSSGSTSSDELLATPFTIAPSELSSPLIQANSPEMDGVAWSLLPVEDDKTSTLPSSDTSKPVDAALPLRAPPPGVFASPSTDIPKNQEVPNVQVSSRDGNSSTGVPSPLRPSKRKFKSISKASPQPPSSQRTLRSQRRIKPSSDIAHEIAVLAANAPEGRAPEGVPQSSSGSTRSLRALPTRRSPRHLNITARGGTSSPSASTRSPLTYSDTSLDDDDDLEGPEEDSEDGDPRDGDYIESGGYAKKPRTEAKTASKPASGQKSGPGQRLPKFDEDLESRCTFPGCNRSFSRSTDVTRHQKTCPFTPGPRTPSTARCDQCGRSYSRQDALQRHWRTSEGKCRAPS